MFGAPIILSSNPAAAAATAVTTYTARVPRWITLPNRRGIDLEAPGVYPQSPITRTKPPPQIPGLLYSLVFSTAVLSGNFALLLHEEILIRS